MYLVENYPQREAMLTSPCHGGHDDDRARVIRLLGHLFAFLNEIVNRSSAYL